MYTVHSKMYISYILWEIRPCIINTIAWLMLAMLRWKFDLEILGNTIMLSTDNVSNKFSSKQLCKQQPHLITVISAASHETVI